MFSCDRLLSACVCLCVFVLCCWRCRHHHHRLVFDIFGMKHYLLSGKRFYIYINSLFSSLRTSSSLSFRWFFLDLVDWNNHLQFCVRFWNSISDENNFILCQRWIIITLIQTNQLLKYWDCTWQRRADNFIFCFFSSVRFFFSFFRQFSSQILDCKIHSLGRQKFVLLEISALDKTIRRTSWFSRIFSFYWN